MTTNPLSWHCRASCAPGGLSTKTYTSAREFLAQRSADEPGCVIVDLRMPDVNGLDLQSALAQTRFALPVLFLTGHADTASTVQAMRAEDVLEKTSPLQALLEVVSRALARDAQERQERFSRQSLHARFARLTGRENEVLVCRRRNTFRYCLDLLQNRVRGGDSLERRGVGVVTLNE